MPHDVDAAMDDRRAELAWTIAAIGGGLILSHLTKAQRSAAVPPAARASWPRWFSWAAPIAVSIVKVLTIWGEVQEPAKRSPTGREAVRRMTALGSTGLGLLSAAIGRGPALRPSQALTLMQSAVAMTKDAASEKRPDIRVISFMPLAAWFGYAVGFAIRSRVIDRR